MSGMTWSGRRNVGVEIGRIWRNEYWCRVFCLSEIWNGSFFCNLEEFLIVSRKIRKCNGNLKFISDDIYMIQNAVYISNLDRSILICVSWGQRPRLRRGRCGVIFAAIGILNESKLDTGSCLFFKVELCVSGNDIWVTIYGFCTSIEFLFDSKLDPFAQTNVFFAEELPEYFK